MTPLSPLNPMFKDYHRHNSKIYRFKHAKYIEKDNIMMIKYILNIINLQHVFVTDTVCNLLMYHKFHKIVWDSYVTSKFKLSNDELIRHQFKYFSLIESKYKTINDNIIEIENMLDGLDY